MTSIVMRYPNICKPVNGKRRNEEERRRKKGRFIGGLKELKIKSHKKHVLFKGGKTKIYTNKYCPARMKRT